MSIIRVSKRLSKYLDDIIEKVTSISKEGETTYMLASGTEVFEYELE